MDSSHFPALPSSSGADTQEEDDLGVTTGPSGAFERFLASAIAAILTIIFSWRFLIDGDRTRYNQPSLEWKDSNTKAKQNTANVDGSNNQTNTLGKQQGDNKGEETGKKVKNKMKKIPKTANYWNQIEPSGNEDGDYIADEGHQTVQRENIDLQRGMTGNNDGTDGCDSNNSRGISHASFPDEKGATFGESSLWSSREPFYSSCTGSCVETDQSKQRGETCCPKDDIKGASGGWGEEGGAGGSEREIDGGGRGAEGREEGARGTVRRRIAVLGEGQNPCQSNIPATGSTEPLSNRDPINDDTLAIGSNYSPRGYSSGRAPDTAEGQLSCLLPPDRTDSYASPTTFLSTQHANSQSDHKNTRYNHRNTDPLRAYGEANNIDSNIDGLIPLQGCSTSMSNGRNNDISFPRPRSGTGTGTASTDEYWEDVGGGGGEVIGEIEAGVLCGEEVGRGELHTTNINIDTHTLHERGLEPSLDMDKRRLDSPPPAPPRAPSAAGSIHGTGVVEGTNSGTSQAHSSIDSSNKCSHDVQLKHGPLHAVVLGQEEGACDQEEEDVSVTGNLPVYYNRTYVQQQRKYHTDGVNIIQDKNDNIEDKEPFNMTSTSGNTEGGACGGGDASGANSIDSVRQRCQQLLEKHNQIKDSLFRDHYNTVAPGSFDNSYSSDDDEERVDGLFSGAGKQNSLKKDSDSDSESGDPFKDNYYGQREYVLSEQMGEDSSDSEYCIIFKRVLEAITEEDTDDLDLDTTGDTDAEVHDIPADDESCGTSDNQGETVAIGNRNRPYNSSVLEAGNCHTGAPSVVKQNYTALQQLGNNGLKGRDASAHETAFIDENKRDLMHEQTTEEVERGRRGGGDDSTHGFPRGGTSEEGEEQEWSYSSIYRVGEEQVGRFNQQRYADINTEMNSHLDKPSSPSYTNMFAPLEDGEDYRLGDEDGEEEERDKKKNAEKENEEKEQVQEAKRERGKVKVVPLPRTTLLKGIPRTASNSQPEPIQGDLQVPSSLPSGINSTNPGGMSAQCSFDLSDTASDTNSIDVAEDYDPEKIKEAESLRCYGGLVNTQRPVTIGPYHDRQSAFARRRVITVQSPVENNSPRCLDSGEEEASNSGSELDSERGGGLFGKLSAAARVAGRSREDLARKTPPLVTPRRGTEHKQGLEAALAWNEEGVVRATTPRQEVVEEEQEEEQENDEEVALHTDSPQIVTEYLGDSDNVKDKVSENEKEPGSGDTDENTHSTSKIYYWEPSTQRIITTEEGGAGGDSPQLSVPTAWASEAAGAADSKQGKAPSREAQCTINVISAASAHGIPVTSTTAPSAAASVPVAQAPPAATVTTVSQSDSIQGFVLETRDSLDQSFGIGQNEISYGKDTEIDGEEDLPQGSNNEGEGVTGEKEEEESYKESTGGGEEGHTDHNNSPQHPNSNNNRTHSPISTQTTVNPPLVLHQAKSLREAALDAVNAPPHDDYYLRSQYYDTPDSNCVSTETGGSAGGVHTVSSIEESPIRPLHQALSSSYLTLTCPGSPSLANSPRSPASEADTIGTDADFDSAEEGSSSFSGRYRTPEGWSGPDSLGEDQWKTAKKQEDEAGGGERGEGAGGVLIKCPSLQRLQVPNVEYAGRFGDGYTLEHWEADDNSGGGTFVVDLKVDVHHLGNDSDQDSESLESGGGGGERDTTQEEQEKKTNEEDQVDDNPHPGGNNLHPGEDQENRTDLEKEPEEEKESSETGLKEQEEVLANQEENREIASVEYPTEDFVVVESDPNARIVAANNDANNKYVGEKIKSIAEQTKDIKYMDITSDENEEIAEGDRVSGEDEDDDDEDDIVDHFESATEEEEEGDESYENCVANNKDILSEEDEITDETETETEEEDSETSGEIDSLNKATVAQRSTSVTERPLKIGPVSIDRTSNVRNNGKLPISNNSDRNKQAGVEAKIPPKPAGRGTGDKSLVLSNSGVIARNRFQSERLSRTTMDPKSKVYQELEDLQDFKETQERGPDAEVQQMVEANQPPRDKPKGDYADQQSSLITAIGHGSEPLDSGNSHEGEYRLARAMPDSHRPHPVQPPSVLGSYDKGKTVTVSPLQSTKSNTGALKGDYESSEGSIKQPINSPEQIIDQENTMMARGSSSTNGHALGNNGSYSLSESIAKQPVKITTTSTATGTHTSNIDQIGSGGESGGAKNGPGGGSGGGRGESIGDPPRPAPHQAPPSELLYTHTSSRGTTSTTTTITPSNTTTTSPTYYSSEGKAKAPAEGLGIGTETLQVKKAPGAISSRISAAAGEGTGEGEGGGDRELDSSTRFIWNLDPNTNQSISPSSDQAALSQSIPPLQGRDTGILSSTPHGDNSDKRINQKQGNKTVPIIPVTSVDTGSSNESIVYVYKENRVEIKETRDQEEVVLTVKSKHESTIKHYSLPCESDYNSSTQRNEGARGKDRPSLEAQGRPEDGGLSAAGSTGLAAPISANKQDHASVSGGARGGCGAVVSIPSETQVVYESKSTETDPETTSGYGYQLYNVKEEEEEFEGMGEKQSKLELDYGISQSPSPPGAISDYDPRQSVIGEAVLNESGNRDQYQTPVNKNRGRTTGIDIKSRSNDDVNSKEIRTVGARDSGNMTDTSGGMIHPGNLGMPIKDNTIFSAPARSNNHSMPSIVIYKHHDDSSSSTSSYILQDQSHPLRPVQSPGRNQSQQVTIQQPEGKSTNEHVTAGSRSSIPYSHQYPGGIVGGSSGGGSGDWTSSRPKQFIPDQPHAGVVEEGGGIVVRVKDQPSSIPTATYVRTGCSGIPAGTGGVGGSSTTTTTGGAPIPTRIFYIPEDQLDSQSTPPQRSQQSTGRSVSTSTPRYYNVRSTGGGTGGGEGTGGAPQYPPGGGGAGGGGREAQVNNQGQHISITPGGNSMGNQNNSSVHYANEIYIDPEEYDEEGGFRQQSPVQYERDKYDLYYSNDDNYIPPPGEGSYSPEGNSQPQGGIPNYDFPTEQLQIQQGYGQNKQYSPQRGHEYLPERNYERGYQQPLVKYASIRRTTDTRGSSASSPAPPLSPRSPTRVRDPLSLLDRSYEDLDQKMAAVGYQRIDPPPEGGITPPDVNYQFGLSPGHKGDHHQRPASPSYLDRSHGNQTYPGGQDPGSRSGQMQQQQQQQQQYISPPLSPRHHSQEAVVHRPQDIPINSNRGSWPGSDNRPVVHTKSPPWRYDRSPSRSPHRMPSPLHHHTPPGPLSPREKSSFPVIPKVYCKDSSGSTDNIDTQGFSDRELHLTAYDKVDTREHGSLSSPLSGPMSPSRSCTALATSTALARKDNHSHHEEDAGISQSSSSGGGIGSRSVVSAIGNAEATGENPYIAVARATARAATIASAHAAAGVAKMTPSSPSDDESGSDINVVISTSCTIKNEYSSPRLESDSQDVIRIMERKSPVGGAGAIGGGGGRGVGVGGEGFKNSSLNYDQHTSIPSPTRTLEEQQQKQQQQPKLKRDGSLEGPKKMVITIEQEGTKEKRSRTVECELPVDPQDDDLSRIISGAVKRILTSSAASTGSGRTNKKMGNEQLDDIIQRVTQQVMNAYISEHYNDEDINRKQKHRIIDDRSGKYQQFGPGIGVSAGSPSTSTASLSSSLSKPKLSPVVNSETIPSFRSPRIDMETYKEMHRVHKHEPRDDDLSKYAVPVNTYGHRLQYVPRGQDPKSKSPELHRKPSVNNSSSDTTSESTQQGSDQTYFYVTGSGPRDRRAIRHMGEFKQGIVTQQGVVSQQGEVKLALMKDRPQQPRMEHVNLSEAEGGGGGDTGAGPGSSSVHKLHSESLRSSKMQGSYSKQGGGGANREIPRHEQASGAEDSPRKIKGILRTSPRVEQQPVTTTPSSSTFPGSYRAKSPPKHFDSRKMAPDQRYSSRKLTQPAKQPEKKKPYDSVLLRPVHDRPTPVSMTRKYDCDSDKSEKRSKIDNARKGYLDLVPKNPPWPKGTILDAAFEEKKRKWFEKTVPKDSPKKGFMVVDIDIDKHSPEDKRSSSEDLKRRLSATRLKAPNSSEIDQRWQSLAKLKPYKSHGNLLDQSLMDDSTQNLSNDSSSDANTSAADLRRAKSLGTLPSQFFANKRSYTSLLETDLDTGVCTETPLIYETDLDGMNRQNKARSLTNLSMKTSMVPIDIDEERRKSFETLPREGGGRGGGGPSLLYSLPNQDSGSECSSLDTSQERSLSAGELRITQSLNKLSIPNWYRQSFGKGIKKPVELTHTRQLREGSSFSGGDSPDSSFEFHRREDGFPGGYTFRGSKENLRRQQQQPYQQPKPVVIQHRVSNTLRAKSPLPPSPSATSEKQGNFELPSSKLKTHHVELKHMETKHPSQYIPPAQIPKKSSAKEAYLKLKAQSHAQDGVLRQANQDQQQLQQQQQHNVNGVKEQPERYTTKSYITLSPQPQRKQMVDETGSPRTHSPSGRGSNTSFPNQAYTTQSLPNHIQSTSRSPPMHTQQNAKSYEPGATCSGLVEKMKLGEGNRFSKSDLHPQFYQHPQQHIPPNAVYSRMLDNIENQRREIQERAHMITTDKSIPPGLINKDEDEYDKIRKSFPVLSYNESPSIQKKKTGEYGEKTGSNVELAIAKDEPPLRSPRSPFSTPRDSGNKRDSSLDQILGGLLAIPSANDPTSPSSEEDDGNTSPKKRIFRLLRNASTPRGSMTSVNTSRTQDNTSDAEDGPTSLQLDSPHLQNLTDRAYERIDPEFALDLYPKAPDKCTEEAAIVKCRNPKCKKVAYLSEARDTYKTCHNCYTYYCGRDCRKAHWERHKKKCLFSRVNSVCKHVVKKVHDAPELLESISKIARTGYMSKGRGCVLIAFSSPEKADNFLREGNTDLEAPAGFANLEDLKEVSDVFAEHYFELVDMCKTYNPEIKFVIEVAVVSGQEIPAWPVPRREGPAIKKCAKLRLSTVQNKQNLKSRGEPETLILTAVPGSEFTENMEEKKAREICFVNIQRKLRQRGVSLRHHFPEVYTKLCAYVSENANFTPMTIYPIDANTGKRFMCLIMPNSEPEVEWMHNPDLLDELGLATQV